MVKAVVSFRSVGRACAKRLPSRWICGMMIFLFSPLVAFDISTNMSLKTPSVRVLCWDNILSGIHLLVGFAAGIVTSCVRVIHFGCGH